MKTMKRMLSVLLASLMLMMAVPLTISAENAINANDKWFGYGVNCYLLNPTIEAGDTDGLQYVLTAEQNGILYLEHKYKDVNYTITIEVDGRIYEGGSVDGEIYNGPIMTLPMQVGDVATIHIVTQDAAAGTVYANMNIIPGDADNPIKVKSCGIQVTIAAGQTVYFQDDSLQASYATKGLLVQGNVDNTIFYTISKNSENGAMALKAVTDTDADGTIEAQLGGSLGSAGAPPVKPAWSIENNSDEDQVYLLTIANDAHECTYDNDEDADCNTCGEIRELIHIHTHTYDHDFDTACNTCNEVRDVELPLNITGNSISEDVNGLAWLVEAKVDGIVLKGTTANYDNATVGSHKLICMGAVLSNNYTELGYVPKLEDVDGVRVIDMPATYICKVNEENGTVSYAVRIINIPDEHKDREIGILTYFIFEDEAGVQHVQYCNSDNAAYNWFV